MTESNKTKAWFTNCIEDNMDALYGVAIRLTRNGADAEDLVADTIVKAWVSIGSLNDRTRFRPWIFRILRNGFISDCRRNSARPPETGLADQSTWENDADLASLLIEQPVAFLNWWAQPETELINNILSEQIMAAINRLPEVFRTTVLLINVEGFTYDETAEVLGVPRGTVRSRMKRGRTLLQKALWEQAKEAGIDTGDDKCR